MWFKADPPVFSHIHIQIAIQQLTLIILTTFMSFNHTEIVIIISADTVVHKDYRSNVQRSRASISLNAKCIEVHSCVLYSI